MVAGTPCKFCGVASRSATGGTAGGVLAPCANAATETEHSNAETIGSFMVASGSLLALLPVEGLDEEAGWIGEDVRVGGRRFDREGDHRLPLVAERLGAIP